MTHGGPRWQSEVSQRSLREAVRGSQRLSAALGGSRWLSVAVRGQSEVTQGGSQRSLRVPPGGLPSFPTDVTLERVLSVLACATKAITSPRGFHTRGPRLAIGRLAHLGCMQFLEVLGIITQVLHVCRRRFRVKARLQERGSHARSRQVTSGHVRSRQVTPGHVRSRQVTPGHVKSRQVTSGHVRSRQVTSSHARSATRRGTQEHYVSLRSTTWHSAALSRQWYSHLEQLGEVLGCESAQLQRRGRRG